MVYLNCAALSEIDCRKEAVRSPAWRTFSGASGDDRIGQVEDWRTRARHVPRRGGRAAADGGSPKLLRAPAETGEIQRIGGDRLCHRGRSRDCRD